MHSITVDSAVLAVLGQAKEPTEICAPGGEILGFFAPKGSAATAGCGQTTPSSSAPNGCHKGDLQQPSTWTALIQAQVLTEICDSRGQVLGFFAPVALEHAIKYAAAAAQIDPEEILRFKRDQAKGRTTEEILARLKSLEKTS